MVLESRPTVKFNILTGLNLETDLKQRAEDVPSFVGRGYRSGGGRQGRVASTRSCSYDGQMVSLGAAGGRSGAKSVWTD